MVAGMGAGRIAGDVVRSDYVLKTEPAGSPARLDVGA